MNMVGPFLNKNDHNKGYTLVEMVVVIGIMVTMIGLLSLGVSVLFSRDSERVAKVIDDKISETRSAAMTKPGTYSIVIHTTSTGVGNYIEIEKANLTLAVPTPAVPGATPTPTPTPDPSLTTRVDLDKDAYIAFGEQGSVPSDASDGTISISFDKANGSITQINDNGTVITGTSLDKVFEIRCTGVRNSTKVSSILLMPITGRHYIEQ